MVRAFEVREPGTPENRAADNRDFLDKARLSLSWHLSVMLRGGRITKFKGQAASYSPELGLVTAAGGAALSPYAQPLSLTRRLLRGSAAPLALAASLGFANAAQAQSVNCPGDLTPSVSRVVDFNATESSSRLVTNTADTQYNISSSSRSAVISGISLRGSGNQVITIADRTTYLRSTYSTVSVSNGALFAPPTADRIVIINNGTVRSSGQVPSFAAGTGYLSAAAYLRSAGGGITITGNGEFMSSPGMGRISGPAIDAVDSGAGSVCISTELATNNGNGPAIRAISSGGGVSIDVTDGLIFGQSGGGIEARDSGGGDVIIRTKELLTQGTGIRTSTTGGDILINSLGIGSGRSILGGGLQANTSGAGNITIETGLVGGSILAGVENGTINVNTTLAQESYNRIIREPDGYGVRAVASGTGSINITTANVEAAQGVYATVRGGTLTIDTTQGDVDAETLGILGGAFGPGEVLIRTGNVTSASGDGIFTGVVGGATVIDSSAGSVSGGRYGISSTDNVDGDIAITSANVSGGSAEGVRIRTNGGAITVNTAAGSVSGGKSGIAATNSGDGVIDLTIAGVTGGTAGVITTSGTGATSIRLSSTAVVTGATGTGIDARSTGGAISVTGNSGDIIGAADGLNVRSLGGAILVDNLDSVTGNAGDGLDLASAGGDITVNAVDTILGAGGAGIRADAGAGNISIQGSGLVGGITGAGEGIIASADGDIDIGGINAIGDVTALGGSGIDARSSAGNVTIDTRSGSISAFATGVFAYTSAASGAIAITTGDINTDGPLTPTAIRTIARGGGITIDTTAGKLRGITSLDVGISAQERGGGDITIAAGDIVEATTGIIAVADIDLAGNISIDTTAGSVVARNTGIYALTGTGSLTITTADVSGRNAILASSVGGAITVDSSAGAVTANQIGVRAQTTGAGTIDLAVNEVTGGTQAIVTSARFGATDIKLSSTAVVSSGTGTGIDARSTGGSISVTGNSGDIIGATDGMYVRSGGGAILVDNLDSVTGNAGDGLDLDSAGGDITVNAVDTILGTGGSGILAVAGAGNISIQGSGLAGGITAPNYGIFAATDGAINVGGLRAIGNVTGANLEGIAVRSGAGAIIDASAGIVSGRSGGIDAMNTGSGALSITSADVAGAGGDGIYALNDGTDLTIDSRAGTVSGLLSGIVANSNGSGAVSITAANVTGQTEAGIIADNSKGTDLTIDTVAGSVTGGRSGIRAENLGDGVLAIITADVTGAGGLGILASNEGTDLFIDSSAGSVFGASTGIETTNLGSGVLSITTADVAGGLGQAIYGRNYGTGLTVDSSAGSVSGGSDGINAGNRGNGDLTITAAAVTGTSGDGIYALNDGTDLTITSSGTVSGGESGIFAYNRGAGALSINAADVTGTTSFGIAAINLGTDLSIDSSSGAVSGSAGIFAVNLGSGAATIVTGDVAGTSDAGIAVSNNAAATELTIDTTRGMVSGEVLGIVSANLGRGPLVIATADVSGTNSDGIRAINANGDLTIDTRLGRVSGGAAFDTVFGRLSAGIYADQQSASALSIMVSDVTGGVGVDANATTGPIAIRLTSDANLIGLSGAGINARATGGAISVTGSSGDVIGATDGIYVRSLGGPILIENLDSVTGNAGDGLDLDSGGGDIAVGSVSAIDGDDGNAIRAFSNGGDIAVTASRSVTGALNGLFMSSGGGAITIANIDSLTGTSRDGIDIASFGGDIVIDAVDTILGGGAFGIRVASGAGNITITNSGLVGGITGMGQSGIRAISTQGAITISGNGDITGAENGILAQAGGAGMVMIDSTMGSVTGGRYGIVARQEGTGATSIVTGDVTGADVAGIMATNAGTDLMLNSSGGAVSGGDYGVFAVNSGNGELAVTTADVTGSISSGIYARNGGTDLTIDTLSGNVAGGSYGILAINAGSGALSVQTAEVTGGGAHAIAAMNAISGTDLALDTSAGSVGGQMSGITAINEGSGALSLVTGNVTGVTGHGILARNRVGAANIDTQGGVVTGNTAVDGAGSVFAGIFADQQGAAALSIAVDRVTGGVGIAANAVGGPISITLGSEAVVTGAIGAGIEARSGGAISISGSSGDIVGATAGLSIRSDADIIVQNLDSVSGNAGNGLDLVSSGGDITVAAVDTVLGTGGNGIFASTGTGNVSLQGSGLLGGISGTDNGIAVIAGGSINIGGVAGLGDISAITGDGILAEAGGNILIDTSAGSVLAGNIGIGATGTGSGTISIAAAEVTGNTTGIFADAGTGNLVLDLSGNVTGGNNGLVTITQDGTALTVAAGQSFSGGMVGIATMAQGGSTTSNDTISILGTVSGALMTFEGDDVVLLTDGAKVDGAIMLGAGNDRFDYTGGTFGAARGGDGFDTLDFNSTGRLINGSGAASDVIAEFEVYNFNKGGFALAGDHVGLSATNFNVGAHMLLGSLASSNVTIANGADLQVADGASIVGSLLNNGDLGLNAGGLATFSIDGNFRQSSSGTTTFDVANGTSFASMTVTGAVNLNGSLAINQVQLVPQVVRLIDGGTGLTGVFADISGLSPDGLLLGQTIAYDRSNFDVNLVTVVNDLRDFAGLTDPDDLSVAPVLTTGFIGQSLGSLGDVALSIGLITDRQELESALTELRPEIALSGIEVFRSSQTAFFQSLQRRSGSIGTGEASSPSGKHVWGSLRYMSYDKAGTGSNPDFDADSYEMATGVAGIPIGIASLDLAAGYVNIKTGQSDIAAPDSSRIEAFRFGANASVDLNPSDAGLQMHLDGTVSFATGKNDTGMTVQIPSAGYTASQSGKADITNYAAGIRLTVEGVGESEWPIKPSVSFAWENIDLGDFDVGTDATALETRGGRFDRKVIGYGLEVDQTFGGSTRLRLGAEANHYLGDTRIALYSRFAQDSNAASVFQTTGEDIRDQYRFRVGLEQSLGNDWRLSVDGRAELGDLEGYGGTLTVSKRF